MPVERGGGFEAVKASRFDVGDSDTGGIAQRLETGLVLRLAILDQPQPFAQHFAGVLIAA